MHKGMTLIELLIALAIFSIICVWAVPIGTDYFDKFHVWRARHTVIRAIGLGRAMALQEGHMMMLSPSPEGWSSGMALTDDSKTHYFWPFTSTRLHIEWVGARLQPRLEISPYLSESMMSGHFTIRAGQRGETLILTRIGRWRVVPIHSDR